MYRAERMLLTIAVTVLGCIAVGGMGGCSGSEPAPEPQAATTPVPAQAPAVAAAPPAPVEKKMQDLFIYLPQSLDSAVGANLPALLNPANPLGKKFLEQLKPVLEVLAKAGLAPEQLEHVWGGAGGKSGDLLICTRTREKLNSADILKALDVAKDESRVGQARVFALAHPSPPINTVALIEPDILIIGRTKSVVASLGNSQDGPVRQGVVTLDFPQTAFWIARDERVGNRAPLPGLTGASVAQELAKTNGVAIGFRVDKPASNPSGGNPAAAAAQEIVLDLGASFSSETLATQFESYLQGLKRLEADGLVLSGFTVGAQSGTSSPAGPSNPSVATATGAPPAAAPPAPGGAAAPPAPATPPPPVAAPAPAGPPAPGAAPAPGAPPAPGTAPAPGVPPAPGTAPAPGAAPVPGPAPAPGAAPVPGPAPAPGAAPVPGPAPAPGAAPAPGPAAAPGAPPAPGTAPVPGAAPVPGPAPAPGAPPVPGPAPVPGAAPVPGPAPAPGTPPVPGPAPVPGAAPAPAGNPAAPAAPTAPAAPPAAAAPPPGIPQNGSVQVSITCRRDKDRVRLSIKGMAVVALFAGVCVPNSFQAAGATPIENGLFAGTLAPVAKAMQQWPADKPDAFKGAKEVQKLPFKNGFSWLTELLPYMGREDVYLQFDFTKSWINPKNVDLATQTIPEFLNPLDPRLRWSGYPFEGVSLTHFVGMSGVEDRRNVVAAALERSDPRAGIFGYKGNIKAEDITDGAAQTIMVIGSGRVVGPWVQAGGATIRGARSPYFDDLTGFGSRGLPQRGTYVMFADGSGRVLSADMDPDVFKAMCTAHGVDSVDLSKLVTLQP